MAVCAKSFHNHYLKVWAEERWLTDEVIEHNQVVAYEEEEEGAGLLRCNGRDTCIYPVSTSVTSSLISRDDSICKLYPPTGHSAMG